MPRTKLDHFSENPETYRRAVNRTIKSAMGRCEIESKKQLGASIGLTENQTSYRFRNGWSDYELFRLNRVLKFTETERAQIYGGQL